MGPAVVTLFSAMLSERVLRPLAHVCRLVVGFHPLCVRLDLQLQWATDGARVAVTADLARAVGGVNHHQRLTSGTGDAEDIVVN
jgi:hypothetical protein